MFTLNFKNNSHDNKKLKKNRYTIGRDPGNDIVLDDERASGFHAELHLEQGKLFLVDLGSRNGTLVNGQLVLGRKEINHWEMITFGNTEVEVVDPDGRRPTVVGKAITEEDIASMKSGQGNGSLNQTQVRTAVDNAASVASTNNKTQVMPALCPQLTMKNGPLAGKNITLNKQELRIGRDESNEIVVDDITVSSFHARLSQAGSDWKLEDNSSTNGTYVNEEKITSRSLKPGDKLRFGKIAGLFTAPGAEVVKKTQVMPVVDDSVLKRDDTQAAPHPQGFKQKTKGKKKAIPAWGWGVAAFLVVGAIGGGYMMRDQLSGYEPIKAPLQIAKVWQQPLEAGRTAPVTPALADVNGDNFLDVIVADGNGHVTAYDGQAGKIIFDADVSGKVLASLAAGDISGDGLPDIVTSGYSGVVTALNGKGQMLWQAGSAESFGNIVNRATLADINDDGIDDVIVPTLKKGLVALDGLRGWNIWDTGELTQGQTVTTPLMADINDDGVIDAVSVTNTGQVLAVSTQGGKLWKLWENSDIPPVLYSSPVLYKVGKDKLLAIATKDNGILVLRADSGRFVWQAKLAKKFFASPVILDANGDDIDDIAVIAKNGDIHIFNGQNGDELWNSALNVGVSATPALFDVNNDKLLDLVILDESGGLHIIDTARGRTILTGELAPGSGFMASPVLGDINNDQLLEIISVSQKGEMTASALNRLVRKGSAPWPVFLGENNLH